MMRKEMPRYTLRNWIGLLTVALSFSGMSLIAQSGTNSIDVPPEMERNFDQLLTDWRKNMKQSPDCDRMGDGNILYHDSTYIRRLHSYPSQMELAYNHLVKSYIEMYTTRNRNSVSVMLGKGRYYNPIFENALDKYGLPTELKYLPVIESAINPIAVSRAGATGLWQFMAATGKMYDLEVNSLVDERRDPLKSTDAAARYLRDLFEIYGDWNLVIAAYNCGPGNVNKAIRRSGGQTDYWTIYPFLPRETRGYVPAFIGATYAMIYHEKHNICAMESPLSVSTDTLMINYNVHFEQIAQVLNVPIEDIRDLNPQYKRDIVPGGYKAYSLSLPSQKAMDYISKKDEIIAYKTEELLTHRKTVEPEGASASSAAGYSGGKIYRVKRGDTLGAIAGKYGVTVNQLKRWNNLRSNNLSIGKRLIVGNPVPVKTQATPTKKAEVTKASEEVQASQNQSSQVESSSVLADYFESQKQKQQQIVENDSIEAPDVENREKSSYDPESSTIYHKVKIGETITSIANKYNVSVADIKKWNKLSASVAKVGQRLLINIPAKVEEKIEEESLAEEEVIKEEPIAKKPEVKAAPKKITSKKTVYTARRGDNLSKIASKHRVSVNSLKKENNLTSDRVDLGQKFVIPRK